MLFCFVSFSRSASRPARNNGLHRGSATVNGRQLEMYRQGRQPAGSNGNLSLSWPQPARRGRRERHLLCVQPVGNQYNDSNLLAHDVCLSGVMESGSGPLCFDEPCRNQCDDWLWVRVGHAFNWNACIGFAVIAPSIACVTVTQWLRRGGLSSWMSVNCVC